MLNNNLTKWNPFWEMNRLERDLLDLFSAPRSMRWTPSIDLTEDESRVLLEAEVPGMGPEDIEIILEDGVLTIKGKKSLKKEEKKGGCVVAERSSGSFSRSFALPSDIETDGIQAKYDKGVLSVEVPKKPPKTPKQIKIKVSS